MTHARAEHKSEPGVQPAGASPKAPTPARSGARAPVWSGAQGLAPAPGLFGPGGLQAKLEVGAADDPLEREADRVAEQVLRAAAPPASAAAPAPAAGGPPTLRRACACGGVPDEGGECPACRARRLGLQRRAAAAAPRAAPPAVHATLRAPGAPLDGATRAFMEPRLGADLGAVRVHADAAAGESARSVGALAYTVGEHIAFGHGQYQPQTGPGRRLIAHELAHTLQQRGLTTVLRRDPAPQQPPPDIVANPPFASMSASFLGLEFGPPQGTVFAAGSRMRQGIAIALKRLLGEEYSPDLVDKAVAALHAASTAAKSQLVALGTLEGEAKGGEPFSPFILTTELALPLLKWLRSGEVGRKYAPAIAPEQEELLQLGVAVGRAWEDLQATLKGRKPGLPEWYRRELFTLEMGNYGTLLRTYRTAREELDKSSDAPERKVAHALALGSIADALIPPAQILEAVRADAKLTAHAGYGLLWRPLDEKTDPKAPPPPVAAPAGPVNLVAAALFLSFVRTQPDLLERALAEGDARLTLLDRFLRFFDQAYLLGTGAGDQQLLNAPAKANRQPHPARLDSSPRLDQAMPLAAMESDHAFEMALLFPSVFDAFVRYSYHWTLIRVPDERFVGTASQKDKSAAQGWSDIYGKRLARDTKYAAADIRRIITNMRGMFGSPGGSVELTAINALMRYAGTLISTTIQVIADPANVQRYVFPSEGLYFVRCVAIPLPPRDAEVVRAPSVAYQPVFARAAELVAETGVIQTSLDRESASKRRDEIRLRLKGELPADERTALEEELKGLDAALGTVGDTLTFQRDRIAQRLAELEKSQGVLNFGEQRDVREALAKANKVLQHRADRGLKNPERLNATFVSYQGQVIRLLMEAEDITPAGASDVTYRVSDLTTSKSGVDQATAANRADAIVLAIQRLLEAPHGYGRGMASVSIDKATRSIPIEASDASLLLEAAGNIATILSIAAIAAAPFTGGASLALFVPAGIVGAVPSAYRLVTRVEMKTFDWDLESAMDIVNIAGALIGLGQAGVGVRVAGLGAAAATSRLVPLGRMFAITGIGVNGLGIMLMSEDLVRRIRALKGMPPGIAASALAQIIAEAMLQIGIMVGAEVASRARLSQLEKAVGRSETSFNGWERTLNEETRTTFNPKMWEIWASFTARVREVLTLCASICVPPSATKEQGARIESTLQRLGATPGDERWLKVYFHDRLADLEGAIKGLEAHQDIGALRQHLAGLGYTAGEVALGSFKNLRKDPALTARAEALIGTQKISVELLGQIMDNVQAQGLGGQRVLGHLENLLTAQKTPPIGYEQVLSDMAKGDNFLVGAKWMLDWIDAQGAWKGVSMLEVTNQAGTRRIDAIINHQRYEFKSWLEFNASTFRSQILKDHQLSGGFRRGQLVRWVFDNAKLGKTNAEIRQLMLEAVEWGRVNDPTNFTQSVTIDIKRNLARILPD